MVVTGETESKVCEGLSALNADAVIVGTHEKGAIARWEYSSGKLKDNNA